MCGFAGFVDRNHRLNDAPGALRTMAQAVAHRGPDGEGFFEDARFGLGIAHRRLAVLDRTGEAAQPMRSPAGRWVVAYNGEVWNYAHLRGELQAGGVPFSSTGDTQVLAAMLDAHGLLAALPRLDGMFAFAAVDLHDRALWLARDRFGVKPCYWGHAEDGRGPGVFVFGSELRALQACPVFRNKVSPFAIAGVLGGMCVPGRRTMYQGAHTLRAGHALRLDLFTGRVETMQWHSTRGAAETARKRPFRGTRDECVRELSGLVDAAVRRRMEADVPVGVLLSGGVDSSLVLGGMQRAGATGVKAFTIGFSDPRYDERKYAREVAAHFGAESIDAEVNEAELPVLVEDAINCFDEPFADASAIPTLLAARLARREVGVVLAGDGGDDLFGGYERHVRGFMVARVLAHVPAFVRHTVATGLASVPGDRWDAMLAPFERVLPNALQRPQRGRLLHKAAMLLVADGAEEVWRGFYTVWPDPAALIMHLPGDAWRATVTRESRAMERSLPDDETGFFDELLLRDQTIYLPDDLLVKLDRATMACGLEGREPLLDQALFEFAWQVPPEWRTQGGVGKRLLRDVLALHAPAHIANRPKAGFGVPLRGWLTGPLRAWVETQLDRSRMNAQGVLTVGPIADAWARCNAGDEAAAAQVWAACVVSRWCEREGVTGDRVARP